MNSFFWAQCSYCALVWMFHSRTLTNKTNRLHERCLSIVYNDKRSTYEILLVRDRPVLIDVRNLQILAKQMFKVQRDLSPPILKEFFNNRTFNYKPRHLPQFTIPRVKSVYNRSESIAHVGRKKWNMILF